MRLHWGVSGWHLRCPPSLSGWQESIWCQYPVQTGLTSSNLYWLSTWNFYISGSGHWHYYQPGMEKHFGLHQYNKSGTKPTQLFWKDILPILPLQSSGSELASEVTLSEILDQVNCSQNLFVWLFGDIDTGIFLIFLSPRYVKMREELSSWFRTVSAGWKIKLYTSLKRGLKYFRGTFCQ